jgi:plastocyanin
MGKFEVGLFGVMIFLVLGVLALIATSSDVTQTKSVESISDVQTLLKEVGSSPIESSPISSPVPAPGFEDVPEMIVKEEPEPKVIAEPEPEVIDEPTVVEVSLPTGSAVPGCEEENACYVPFSITINVGDTVLWSNDDSAAHTVTSGTPSDGPNGLFDSSIFMSAATFEHTFTESGIYDYFCMVHPWMAGQIQVN